MAIPTTCSLLLSLYTLLQSHNWLTSVQSCDYSQGTLQYNMVTIMSSVAQILGSVDKDAQI